MAEHKWKIKVRVMVGEKKRTEVFFSLVAHQDNMLEEFSLTLKSTAKREGWEVLKITAERLNEGDPEEEE